MCPSMKILFAKIERVKAGILGLCLPGASSLSKKTWQRLGTRDIICDSVPNPSERVGFSMHVKVARRRCQGMLWVPNFSAAALGQPITHSHGDDCPATVGSSLLWAISLSCATMSLVSSLLFLHQIHAEMLLPRFLI